MNKPLYAELNDRMIDETRARLLRGEVFLHHTGHMPGIGGSAFAPEVTERIGRSKGRALGKGQIVLVPGVEFLPELSVTLSPRVRRLLQQYWPGNLSVALPCADPDLEHLAVDGCVAFRAPTAVLLRHWLAGVGLPVTSTSVNRSSEPPLLDLEVIRRTLSGWYDFSVLFGTEYAEPPVPSTLIRFEGDNLEVLRQGSVPAGELEESWRSPLILFVCTGNICRSPMAEHYARHRLQQLGLPLRVASAGFLLPGLPASPQARQTLAEKGLSAENHRSTQLSAEVLRSAWRIYTMEERHRNDLVALAPNAAHKIFTLGEAAEMPGDVADPYMQPVARYRETFAMLKERIDAITLLLELELKNTREALL